MGCALYITHKDFEQMKKTIGQAVYPAKAATIMKNYKEKEASLDPQAQNNLKTLLKNPSVIGKNLVTVLGNGKISNKYAGSLPAALKNILDKNKGAMDLFNQIHVTSWGLNTANSLVYKVLITSQLLSRPDKNLSIKATDSFTVGKHLRAERHPAASSISQDDPLLSLLAAPAEATLAVTKEALDVGRGVLEETINFFLPMQKNEWEPDITIHRGKQNIGVDFSYLDSGNSCKIDSSKLDAIAAGIKLGRFDEFHIVSNNEFTTETKRELAQLNEELKSSGKQPIEFYKIVVY